MPIPRCHFTNWTSTWWNLSLF